jgi:DNA-binding transcriptional ArsR family regulator
MPHLAKYEGHFPTAAFGPEPNKTVPTTVFTGLATAANPPKTVAILTSKFPSAQFLSSGAKEVAEKRGLKVVLYLEYEFGTRDWAAMAARVKDAKPDLLWVGALGLDGNQLIEAMKKLDYMPPRHFHLFPAPGPLALSPDGKQALSVSVFEEHPPFMANPKTARLVGLFREKATKANVPYPNVDTQVAGSFAALADPTRRRVLALLRERDMTAGELAAHFDLSWPTMSGHFTVLREADLIAADKVGTTITYHLNLSVLEEAMAALLEAFRIEPKTS